MDSIESMLTGGHPNSLGNTIAVVELVLKDKSRLEELYQCYFSNDDVVRLRVSSAMKRICRAKPKWLVPYIDKLLTDIAGIDQASTQWTLAQLFVLLANDMSYAQKANAVDLMKNNLLNHKDWIVLNTTMEALYEWSKLDKQLELWLKPQLVRLQTDPHGSVARRARKYTKELSLPRM